VGIRYEKQRPKGQREWMTPGIREHEGTIEKKNRFERFHHQDRKKDVLIENAKETGEKICEKAVSGCKKEAPGAREQHSSS